MAASKPSGGNKFMSVLSEGYAEQMPGAPAGSRGVSPEEILASQVKQKRDEVDRMMREAYYSVWKFVSKDGEVAFVQFDGSYQSYSGSEFDDYFFVEPKQVEVTQYVKAK